MMKYFLLTVLSIVYSSLLAQDSPKLSFRFRALIDLSTDSYNNQELKGYYKLEDLRIGFKAGYESYEIKTKVGIRESGLAVKDILFSYFFNESVIVLGNGYESFSMVWR